MSNFDEAFKLIGKCGSSFDYEFKIRLLKNEVYHLTQSCKKLRACRKEVTAEIEADNPLTGLYRQSLIGPRREANGRVDAIRASLDSLENKETQYAQEHRDLLALYERVAAIYNDALGE